MPRRQVVSSTVIQAFLDDRAVGSLGHDKRLYTHRTTTLPRRRRQDRRRRSATHRITLEPHTQPYSIGCFRRLSTPLQHPLRHTSTNATVLNSTTESIPGDPVYDAPSHKYIYIYNKGTSSGLAPILEYPPPNRPWDVVSIDLL